MTTRKTLDAPGLQAAIDDLGLIDPLVVEEVVILPAGDVAGGDIAGATGPASLTVLGELIAAEPATGVASGTAGAGTSTTALKKPTAAADWTASDSALVGRLMAIISGGGAGADPANAPVLRVIKAVATDTITVDAVTGMDSTTHFKLVNCGSVITSLLTVERCHAPVVLRALNFGTGSLAKLLQVDHCDDITLDGCQFTASASDVSALIEKCGNVSLSNCSFIANTPTLTVNRCDAVDMDNNSTQATGLITVSNCRTVEVRKHLGAGASGGVLAFSRCGSVEVAGVIGTSGTTPVTFADCGAVTATALSGANAEAAYGLTITRCATNLLTGSSIAGAADYAIDGTPGSW